MLTLTGNTKAVVAKKAFWTTATVSALAICLVGNVTAAEADRIPAKGSGLVALVPLLRFDSASDMVVETEFENNSKQPIRYLLAMDGKSVAHFEPLLLKNGDYLRRQDLPSRVISSPSRVRELEPGRAIPHLWSLRKMYGILAPGRYELRLRYSGASSDLELGILPFEQKMYLEIESKAKP